MKISIKEWRERKKDHKEGTVKENKNYYDSEKNFLILPFNTSNLVFNLYSSEQRYKCNFEKKGTEEKKETKENILKKIAPFNRSRITFKINLTVRSE